MVDKYSNPEEDCEVHRCKELSGYKSMRDDMKDGSTSPGISMRDFLLQVFHIGTDWIR